MTQGRRGFFAKLIGAARELDAELSGEPATLEADPSDTPRFVPPPVVPEPTREIRGRSARRPPGALPEVEFIATCTRCMACIEACPESTLALDRGGLPIAEPWRSACALCPTTPCIAACEPRALTPTAAHAIRIGRAVVLSTLCLNQDDDLCDRCLDWCPVPLAITTANSPIPTVDPDRCTGCGLCVAQCPALPRAIALR